MAAPSIPLMPDARRIVDVAGMESLGARIAAGLKAGEAVCLGGPLGAGKSTLARGLIRALTIVDAEVPSPTFTLVQGYEGRIPLAHFDLYRLKDPSEAYELGLDEALDVGAAVIEWPERLQAALPPDRLDVEISLPETGEGRLVRVIGRGSLAGRDLDL